MIWICFISNIVSLIIKKDLWRRCRKKRGWVGGIHLQPVDCPSSWICWPTSPFNRVNLICVFQCLAVVNKPFEFVWFLHGRVDKPWRVQHTFCSRPDDHMDRAQLKLEHPYTHGMWRKPEACVIPVLNIPPFKNKNKWTH